MANIGILNQETGIALQYNADGNPYFTYQGEEYNLDDFMRFDGLVVEGHNNLQNYENYNGIMNVIGQSALIIKVNEEDETVDCAFIR